MTEDDIYDRLKAAIVGHRLPPGTRLAEESLAAAFGVSRTPMRNVLRRLAYERLVVVERNRGASVYSPTPEDAREVFEMRRILEDAVVARVAPRLVPEDLTRLRQIDAADAAAAARGDFPGSVRIAADFHVALARFAGNSLLVRGLAELVDLTYVIVALYGQRFEEIGRTEAHEALLDALEARDEPRARAVMREHLDRLVTELDYTRPASREIDFRRLFAPASEGRRSVIGTRGRRP